MTLVPTLPVFDADVDTEGPDVVDAKNRQISLFNMQQTYSLNLGSGVEVKHTFDKERGTRKIAISSDGKITDFDDIKKVCTLAAAKEESEKRNDKLNKDLRDRLENTGKFVSTKTKYSVMVYLELDMAGNFKNGGGVVALKASGDLTYRPICTGGIAYAKLTLGLEGKCKLNIVYDKNSNELAMATVLSLQPEINIAGGIGYEYAHLEIGANGTFTINIDIPWENARESLAVNANVSLYGEARFLLWTKKESKTLIGPPDSVLWPRPGNSSVKSGNPSAQNIMPVTYTRGSQEEMTRDYLGAAGSGGAVSTYLLEEDGVLSVSDSFRYSEISQDSGVFEENNVQYVQLENGTELLAWVHDFGDKSNANRTTLVYSVNKNDGTGWGKITPVCGDSSTGDFYPAMTAVGNKAYLVWNKASEVFGDAVDSDYAMKHMDVCLAVFEDGAFGEPQILSDPLNEVMEMSPIVAADGKRAAVAWLVNSENDYCYAAGTNAIYVREYQDGIWGSEICYAEDLHDVSDYDLGYVGGQLAVAYAEDADGATDTEDGTVYLAMASREIEDRITDTRAAAAAAAMMSDAKDIEVLVVGDSSYDAMGVELCGDALYFSGKDGVYRASGKDFAQISDTGIQTDNFSVMQDENGREAVAFLAKNGFASDLLVSYCRGGSYTLPVPLVADGSRVRHYAPVCHVDGSVSVAYIADEVLENADYHFGLTDMVMEHSVVPDVFSVDDVLEYNAYDVAPGGEVEFIAEACNYTMEDVTAVQAVLKGSVSGTVYEDRMAVAIPVGESRIVRIPYTLPETVVNEEFTLTLTPADFEDKDISDNMAACELGYSDIAVTECRVKDNLITGTVKNIGYKTAENVKLMIREDDMEQEPFAVLTCGSGKLAAGESWEFSQKIATVNYSGPYDVKYYLLETETDSIQNDYANDSTIVYSSPIVSTGIALNKSELAMTEKSVASLVATVTPAEALSKKVKYISNDNSVALVDGNGNVYAVGPGIATITAFTADCAHFAKCVVTVEPLPEDSAATAYTLSSKTMELKVGEARELTLTDESTGGGTVAGTEWFSTDESIVTVDENGTVQAVGEGPALVMVKAGSFVDVCSVRVWDYSISQLYCDKKKLEMTTGDSSRLEIVILPENTDMNKKLRYESADETIATVDAEGNVTAVAAGRTVVTVTSKNGVELNLPVIVSAPVIYKIMLDAAGGNAVAPLEVRAYRNVVEEDGVYRQSYTGYLETVPVAGRMGYVFKGWYTGKDGSGEKLTTETAIVRDMTYYAHWEEAVYTVTLDKDNLTLRRGESAQLSAVVLPDDGVALVYSTENSEIATVSETGLVTGVGIGSTTVTAAAGNAVAQCNVTVTEEEPDEPEEGSGDGGTGAGHDQTGLHVALPDGTTYTYTGSPVKPTVIVTNNGERLSEGSDYTVKYSSNLKAADRNSGRTAPKVTVTGKGNFVGSTSVNFTISPKSFADGIGTGSGSSAMPELWYPTELHVAADTNASPVLFYGCKKLTAKDYDLSSSADRVVKPGKIVENCKLYIIGKGNFTGTAEINVKAVPKTVFKKISVSQDKGFQPVYDGNGHKPVFNRPGADVEVTAKDGTALQEEKDFHVVYSADVVNAGMVKYFVVGLGDYTGVISKSYKISPVKASESDFKVDFNNKTGSYPYSPAGVTVSGLTVSYQGKAAGGNGGNILLPGRDYNVAYRNNKKVGTAQLKITFLGNYKGSKAKAEAFNIAKAYLDAPGHGVKVAVPDKVYKKAGIYKSAPVVTYDGVAVRNSDYRLSYEYRDASGNWQSMEGGNKLDMEKLGTDSATVRVTITGAGNYSDDAAHVLSQEYQVCRLRDGEIDLSKAKVTFYDADGSKNKLGYTGREVMPFRVEVSCKAGGSTVTLTEGRDYTISYLNNIGKGKSTAVINGTGTAGTGGKVFRGGKSADFMIAPMNVKDKVVVDNVSAVANEILDLLLKSVPAVSTLSA